MEPTTLRLPAELAEELADEADERGYSSRSEYIRHVLRNRNGGGPNTHTAAIRHRTDYATEYDEELRERVAELEARVDGLERERTGAGDVGGGDREDDVDDGADAEPSDESAASGRRSDDDEDRDVRGDVSDRVRAVVDGVAEEWGDAPDRLDVRRAAAAAVLEHAVETGDAVGKSEAIDGFHAEYAVDGQSAETWWRKNIRPVLSAVGTYDNGAHGYVVDDLGEV